MLPFLRRFLLLGFWLTACILSWWTPDHLLSLRYLPGSPNPGLHATSRPELEQLSRRIASVATAEARDAELEKHLPTDLAFLPGSTLQFPAARYIFWFGPRDSVYATLDASLPSGESRALLLSGERLLLLSRSAPRSSRAPEDLVHPWSGSLSGWCLLLGLLAYLVLGLFEKPRKRPLPFHFRQTLFGLGLATGAALLLLLRNDPSSNSLDLSQTGNLMGWTILLLGIGSLLAGSLRAWRGERETASAPINHLLMALGTVAALGLLAGFFRMATGFVAGIQGMVLGSACGCALGFFLRHEGPVFWTPRRSLMVAGLATLVFLVSQFLGMNLGLHQGDILKWLEDILSGTRHELLFGFRRYRPSVRMQPGPVAWLFFNSLDSLFQAAFTLITLRLVLVPDQEEDEETEKEHESADSENEEP